MLCFYDIISFGNRRSYRWIKITRAKPNTRIVFFFLWERYGNIETDERNKEVE